jgi:hypothetical protein
MFFFIHFFHTNVNAKENMLRGKEDAVFYQALFCLTNSAQFFFYTNVNAKQNMLENSVTVRIHWIRTGSFLGTLDPDP